MANCLSTTGGLAGTRASPLAQHYYCSLPGLSPDIRGCFTFQLRLPRVSRTRSAWDDGYLVDGTKLPIQKGWNSLVPTLRKCPMWRPRSITASSMGVPTCSIRSRTGKPCLWTLRGSFRPPRVLCAGWAQTQLQIFQSIMSGTIDPPLSDQIALLQEYYGCDAIKGKVSASRFKILCGFSADSGDDRSG